MLTRNRSPSEADPIEINYRRGRHRDRCLIRAFLFSLIVHHIWEINGRYVIAIDIIMYGGHVTRLPRYIPVKVPRDPSRVMHIVINNNKRMINYLTARGALISLLCSHLVYPAVCYYMEEIMTEFR